MIHGTVCVCADLERPVHGDGKVVLPARVSTLTDEHLVTDTPRLSCLLGVQFPTNHLRGDVTRLLWSGGGA